MLERDQEAEKEVVFTGNRLSLLSFFESLEGISFKENRMSTFQAYYFILCHLFLFDNGNTSVSFSEPCSINQTEATEL